MDPDENEIHKFLGVEHADEIKTEVVFECVKSEVEKRVKMPGNTKFNDTNFISTINVNIVPVAAYSINACKFSKGELNELDKIVKKELKANTRETNKWQETLPKRRRWRKRVKINA